MPKRLIILLALLVVVLAACQSQAETVTPATETVQPETETNSESYADPEDVATPASSEPAATSQATEPGVSLQIPGCTVVSQEPTPGPTEESIFPPVTDEDWVRGAEDATVTITEYSDFQ